MATTQQAGRTRSRLVAAARAGLIPACDDVAEEASAKLRQAALLVGTMKRTAGTTPRASDQLVIADILAHLRYYCSANGWSFRQIDLAAKSDDDEWQNILRLEGVRVEP